MNDNLFLKDMVEDHKRHQIFIHEVRGAIEKAMMKQMMGLGIQADIRSYVLTLNNVKQLCNALRSKYMRNTNTCREGSEMICSLLCQF